MQANIRPERRARVNINSHYSCTHYDVLHSSTTRSQKPSPTQTVMADDEVKQKEEEAQKQARAIYMKEPKIEPHINASIWPIEDGKWAMGSLMLCERLLECTEAPNDAIVTWQDSKGVAYYLHPRKDSNPAPPYDPANGPIIPRHFTSALFEIGTDVLVKVRYAPKGWPKTEGTALRLVREKAPEVPVPEAIHFWHDKEWDRYFLILRRVHGQTLDKVWFTLTERDKVLVSNQVARYIRRAATITSPLFQHPDGEPLGELRLMHADGLTGTWDPIHGGWPGPFTHDEFRAYLKETTDGLEPPEFDSQFRLYQGDPTPENIIVTGAELSQATALTSPSQVLVAAIIDWERAGFYPDFWSLLHPNVPISGFELSLTMEQAEEDEYQMAQYRDNLISALVYLDDQDHGERYEALNSWWLKFRMARLGYLRRKAQERREAVEARVAA